MRVLFYKESIMEKRNIIITYVLLLLIIVVLLIMVFYYKEKANKACPKCEIRNTNNINKKRTQNRAEMYSLKRSGNNLGLSHSVSNSR